MTPAAATIALAVVLVLASIAAGFTIMRWLLT